MFFKLVTAHVRGAHRERGKQKGKGGGTGVWVHKAGMLHEPDASGLTSAVHNRPWCTQAGKEAGRQVTLPKASSEPSNCSNRAGMTASRAATRRNSSHPHGAQRTRHGTCQTRAEHATPAAAASYQAPRGSTSPAGSTQGP